MVPYLNQELSYNILQKKLNKEYKEIYEKIEDFNQTFFI
jgi:hypothetical protein